jgi:hypothetical protein
MIAAIVERLGESIIPWLTYSLGFYSYNQYFTWFFLPLGSSPLLFFVWRAISWLVAAQFIWQAVNRRFRNPNTTLISKGKSYVLVTLSQIWITGWFGLDSTNSYNNSWISICFFITLPFLFIILIAAVSPNRQYLLDWSRYRHQNYTRDRGIWKDLIWGEKSPAIVAIAINLLITAAIWIAWLLFLPEDVLSNPDLSKLEAILAILLTIGIILIYAVISHVLLLTKQVRSRTNRMAIFATIIILPLLISGVVQLIDIPFPQIWLFTPLPILFFGQGSIITAVLGFCLQLIIIGLLTWQFTKQIQKVGESATKALLTKGN